MKTGKCFFGLFQTQKLYYKQQEIRVHIPRYELSDEMPMGLPLVN